MTTDERTARWASEAAFFDRWAEDVTVTPLSPAVLSRYSNPGTLWHKEFRLKTLGDLTGRHVLEMGCGEGANVSLLAKLGATVTGIDISPKAIEVAQQRAAANGVADRCEFICSPMETVGGLEGRFDVIHGDAILHHLIPELDELMARLVSWTKPGGTLIFAEPVNFAPWLRAIRHKIPVYTEATPDERPLEPAEIAIVRRHIPSLQLRHFQLTGRLNRFVVPHGLETAPLHRKMTAKALAMIDAAAFTVPWFRSMAGYAVLWGRK